MTPVALKILSSLDLKDPTAILDHISTHVRGFELDRFSAWISQVVLESALIEVCRGAGKRLPGVITVCDALSRQPDREGFDLVIGNPPYGRLTLEPELRAHYQRSLHGHANAYGLFMDLGVRWARSGGVIAYITPTGFLGGHYFKELRKLMAEEAPPLAINLVTSRKGVFSDVLQETLLAAYRKGGKPRQASVHILSLQSEITLDASLAGTFSLPGRMTDPWLIPGAVIRQNSSCAFAICRIGCRTTATRSRQAPWSGTGTSRNCMPTRSVALIRSSGPSASPRMDASSTVQKKNHKPYLRPKKGQEWLLTAEPCVLVQRTTAKEQRRRLIAAVLPGKLIRKFGAVAVENHLNMVRPVVEKPAVSLRVIAALLNSEVVDAAFRCISGSVAVSATELEALPLPAPAAARHLEELLEAGATQDAIQNYIRNLYMREPAHVAA